MLYKGKWQVLIALLLVKPLTAGSQVKQSARRYKNSEQDICIPVIYVQVVTLDLNLSMQTKKHCWAYFRTLSVSLSVVGCSIIAWVLLLLGSCFGLSNSKTSWEVSVAAAAAAVALAATRSPPGSLFSLEPAA